MHILLIPFWILGAIIQWLGSVVEWAFETIGALLPIFGIMIAVVSAMIAAWLVLAMILGIRVPGVLRARRRAVRAIGWVLVACGSALVIGFTSLAVIAGAAVAILS